MTAKQGTENPLGMKTLILSSFRSCCPSLPLTKTGLCLVPSGWQCVPAPVSHSAHGDTVYSLITTVSERVLQYRHPISKVQAVLRRVRPRQRQSKILSVPVGLVSEEEPLVLLLTELHSSLAWVTSHY